MSSTSRKRVNHGRRMQRRCSDESMSSATSPAKTHRHRRSSSFNGLTSLGGLGSDVDMKLSPSKDRHPLDASWSSSSSSAFSHTSTMECSPEHKAGRKNLGHEEEDKSFCAFELIRQLSFSPTQTIKKRANTADTDASSSSGASSDMHYTIGLDLDVNFHQSEELKRSRSPSPLLGLKYLPEENMFI